ncbi:MAG: SurA N-terminal domain-containing protein [Gammaproteobacteria bacterium]|nr:SurA N-terminal domain-containing protein [Gammaproteobacteria bacterium]
MLQRIRDKLTGWVAGSIIFIIAIAFIFWGIDFGFFNRDYIALVNGEEVPANQYLNAVQNQVSQAQRSYQDELPESLLKQIRSSVLENLISRELLSQRIKQRGYRVGDELLLQSIRDIGAFQVDGEFSLDVYHARLAGVGRNATTFEAEQRESLQMGQIQDGIAESEFLTASEATRLIELFEQKREVSVARITPQMFETAIQVDDAAVQAYYDQYSENYLTPETVTLRYLEIQGADQSDEVEVSDEELRTYFEKVKDQYTSIERRTVRHILIEAGDDEAVALAHAQELAGRLQGGEDFAAVAAAESADIATASAGGDLGWVDPETFEGDLKDAIFSLPVGQVSDPVRSPFGFHILRVDNIEAGSSSTYDQVRDELEVEYRKNKSAERYYARAEKLAELAFENPSELQTAADAVGVGIKEIPEFTRNNQLSFPDHPEVAEAAFSLSTLEDGENSRVIELGETHALVLRVADHRLPQPQPLETVRDAIVQTLKSERGREMAATAGSELLAAVEQGATLEAAAAEKSADYQPARLVGRGDRQASPELVAAIFRAAKPVDGPLVTGMPLFDGSYVVYVVSEVLPGRLGSVSAEARLGARRAMAKQLGSATFENYVQDLRQKATVQVFEDNFAQTPQR